MILVLTGLAILSGLVALSYGFLATLLLVKTNQALGWRYREARTVISNVVELSLDGKDWTIMRIQFLYLGLGLFAVSVMAWQWQGFILTAESFTLAWWVRG